MINREVAVFFLGQFREARLTALHDAEAFQAILLVIERLGLTITKGQVKRTPGLGAYKDAINELANLSTLSKDIPLRHPVWHSTFAELYESVKRGRNDALHQGAYARHLTNHTIQLALILEDALMSQLGKVTEYMVREPICAFMWYPVSFARQQMLANSFSHLPILRDIDSQQVWHLISDYQIVKYLSLAESNTQRRKFLEKTIEEALSSGLPEPEKAVCIQASSEIRDINSTFEGKPLLVVDENSHLIGILTSFDLL